HQQDEIAVTQIGHEEYLVALEARGSAAQLAYVARCRRPHPPLLPGTAGRDVEVARPSELTGREILHEGAMLGLGGILLEDFSLARRTTAVVKALQRHDGPAIVPGREAIAYLRLLDDFAPG